MGTHTYDYIYVRAWVVLKYKYMQTVYVMVLRILSID